MPTIQFEIEPPPAPASKGGWEPGHLFVVRPDHPFLQSWHGADSPLIGHLISGPHGDSADPRWFVGFGAAAYTDLWESDLLGCIGDAADAYIEAMRKTRSKGDD